MPKEVKGIPVKRNIKISLEPQTPSALTVEEIQDQLGKLGLDCKLNNPANINEYKHEVEEKWEDGKAQAFSILKPKESTNGEPYLRSSFGNHEHEFLGYQQAAKGEWIEKSSAYNNQLSTVVFSSNFDYLESNYPQSFPGLKSSLEEEEEQSTIEAVKKLFISVGVAASSSTLNGISKDTLSATLSNAIASDLENKNKNEDLEANSSRTLFLVENYDPTTEEAEQIGALSINWYLYIKDYKEKDKDTPRFKTTLKIEVRAVMYASLDNLERDFKRCPGEGFRNYRGIPITDPVVEIFEKLPPANESVFDQGLPVTAENEFADVLILYAPNLESIGSVDNRNSSMEVQFQKTVTEGFTFTAEQSISAGLEMEAGIIFAKAKVTFELTLTFSQSWNKETSETVAFTVAAGEVGYFYQGVLFSRILRYNPADKTYKYVDKEARCLTNFTTALNEPLKPKKK